MSCEIIGDRFVLESPGSWRDLATGDEAIVEIGEIPADWEDRSQALAEEITRVSRIIDYGRVGVTRWFEARRERPRGVHQDEVLTSARAAEEVAAVAARFEAFGVRFVRPSDAVSDPGLAAGTIARRLRPLGFVCLRAGIVIPSECAAELHHRHLAVLLLSQQDRHEASLWIRRLAHVSVRGHLLVDLSGGPDRTTGPSVVRERLPEAWAIDRARLRAERGRTRDAEQWYRAAIESGRRHRNDLVQVEACRALVRLQIRRDAWASAAGTAEALLASIGNCQARGDLSVILASLYVARGQVARAEALLASALADRHLTGEPPEPDLPLCHAELRFWQGRFEEASATLTALPAVPETFALRGLIAWATGDPERLSHARSGLATVDVPDATSQFWGAALDVLALPVEVEERRLSGAFAALDRAVKNVCSPSLARLARASAAEALLMRGRREDALAALGPKTCLGQRPSA